MNIKIIFENIIPDGTKVSSIYGMVGKTRVINFQDISMSIITLRCMYRSFSSSLHVVGRSVSMRLSEKYNYEGRCVILMTYVKELMLSHIYSSLIPF